MMPWFVWKNKNSLTDYGIWISKLPKRVRAKERNEEIEIPGRSGSLLMLEGEDVYSSFTTNIVIIARNDINIDAVAEWLRGKSELVLYNDLDKARDAKILNEVSFERVGNCLIQATVPILCDPFKKLRHSKPIVFSSTSKTIINNGDVISRPVLKIVGSGNNTISIAGKAMVFSNLNGTSDKPVIVDCDAQMITKDSEIWQGSVTGDFWTIPKGEVEITQTGNMTLSLEPNWRWL